MNFMIAESGDGSSTTTNNCAVRSRRDNKNTEQKKMPANGGRAQPKIGPRDAEFGAVCREQHTFSITHIGCVYPDEPSIGTECDLTMTLLKGARHRSGTFTDEISQQEAGKKKAR
jgi:hypothetical protein